MDNNIETLVPIWVLMEKVESDHETWQMFNRPDLITEYSRKMYHPVTIDDIEEEEDILVFPELDSTKKILEILEAHNIYFNAITGEWS